MFARPLYWWIGGGVLAVIVTSLGIGTTWSYLKTAWREVGQTIRDATPIAFELQRLDTMLQDLQPEIRRNLQVVAQIETEVEYLEKEIAELKAQQEQLFAQMQKLRAELGTDKTEFQFAGRTYSRSELENDLARRLDRFEQQETVLRAKEELLQQKKRTLETARQKVAAYRQTYDQLLAQSESLKAQLKLIEAAAAAGSVSVNNSKLAEAQRLARDIEMRLRTTQRMLDADRVPAGEIPVDAGPTESVVDRFDRLLERRAPQAQQAQQDREI